jgi:DNA gyrase subunit A
VPDEESVLVLTAAATLKEPIRKSIANKSAAGVGVVDLDTKEEDFVTQILTTNTHSGLLFFTDKGQGISDENV